MSLIPHADTGGMDMSGIAIGDQVYVKMQSVLSFLEALRNDYFNVGDVHGAQVVDLILDSFEELDREAHKKIEAQKK